MPDERLPSTDLTHASLASLFKDIADVIRYKRSDLPIDPEDADYQELIADQFDEEILDIVTFEEGTASSQISGAGKSAAAAGDILEGKAAFLNGSQLNGTMKNNGATGGTITTQGGQIVIPAGYTSGGTVTANLTAGDYTPSVASHSITTTPVVTPSIGGTVTDITVDTKPSGTDGTDYWTLNPGGSVTTTGKSSTTAKAVIGTAGYLAKDTTGKTTSPANVVDITPTVADGTNIYIKKGSASTPSGKEAVITPSLSIDKDTGVVTATGSATVSVTPTTTAGYIAANSGSAANVTGKIASTGNTLSLGVGTASTPTGKEAVITPSFSLDATTGKVTVTGSATVSVTPTTTEGFIKANAGSAANVTGKIKTTENANVYDLGVGTATTPSGKKATITPSFSFDDTTGVVTVTGSNTVSVTPTTTAGYIKANAGVAANVTGEIASTGNTYSVGLGSATTPTDSITKNPTIEWDSTNNKIKASYSGSKSITPTTAAGYIAADSGTAGTISTSGTTSVTVASLDSEFKAANIAKGVTIFGVPGSYTSDGDATDGDILYGKIAYANGNKRTGSMANNGDVSDTITTQGGEVSIPAGYTSGGTITANISASALDNTIISGSAYEEDTDDYAWKTTVTIPAGYHEAQTIEKTFSSVFPAPDTEGTSDEVLLGYELFDHDGKKITGTMPNNSATGGSITTQGGTYTIPAGYTTGGTVTANINAGALGNNGGEVAFVGTGSASASATGKNNLSLGTKATTAPSSGYYIQVDGSGTVTAKGRGSVKVTTAGYLALNASATSNYSSDSSKTVSATSYYPITTSTLGSATDLPLPTGATATDLAYNKYIKIPAGYNHNDRYIKNSVGAGSAKTPATTVSVDTSTGISWDASTKTISVSKSASQNVTPTVTAGYVSSGTAGSVTASASGSKVLTNADLAAADSNIAAGNIKTGVTILGVEGTYTSDATAAAGNILSGKTAYVNGSKITGSMTNNGAGSTTTLDSSTTSKTIAAGYWSSANTVQISVATLAQVKTALGVS